MPFGKKKTKKILSLLFLYSRSIITVVSELFLIFRGLWLPWYVYVIFILFVIIQRPNELSCRCELFETTSSISLARESLDKRLQQKVKDPSTPKLIDSSSKELRGAVRQYLWPTDSMLGH